MARNRPGPELLLPLAAGLLVLLTCAHAPVVDEEVYLWLAGAFAEDPLHPYAFSRTMQPWVGGSETFAFAHPPLHWAWIAGWRGLVGAERLWLLRAVVALPPAMLLGWATARLARRTTRRPGLVAVAWLASPVTALAIASGLMIDLSAVALATAGVVAWREAIAAKVSSTRLRWLLGAGVLLGLGVATKYPMLVLAFVVATHALRLRRIAWSWPLWAAMLGVWGAVELWIGLAHGGFHLGAVLLHAGEIARGSLAGRSLGVLTRTGLAMAPLLLFFSGRKLITGASVVGAAAMAWALPPELGTMQVALVALLALMGANLVGLAGAGLAPRAQDEAQDGWLLGAWVLFTMAAVILGHNFASGRYLLPAMAPLACVVVRGLQGRSLARAAAPAVLGAWAVISVAMLIADHRYARAVDRLAQQVISEHEPAWFVGEWAMRWRLEQAGWRYAAPEGLGEPLEPGDIVVSPTHAAPGPLPWERLETMRTISSPDTLPLRINDSEARVGWYGETLGALPIGWRRAPLDEITVYRVR
jgi:4-amino-4-deoxy-L-arabinose transferase-like glycosyltransferase